jgi:hypothetical protein
MQVDGLRGRRYFYGVDYATFIEFKDAHAAGGTA